MPELSLVVCIYKERALLERLLQNTKECFDELVVIHDGPEKEEPNWVPSKPNSELAIDWARIPLKAQLPKPFNLCQSKETPGSLREFVRLNGGKFFEHPKVGSLEAQSPFAWWAANHDWILRLDADELPSREMIKWLIEFRQLRNVAEDISGFTCVWPLWNGYRQLNLSWPDSRLFLFNRRSIRYVGIIENIPTPLGYWEKTSLVLNHFPRRKSYGYRNLLVRKQAYLWRRSIALNLQYSPIHLPRWNYSDSYWPRTFQKMRDHPWKYIFECLTIRTLSIARPIVKHRMWSVLYAIPSFYLHHALICLEIIRLRRSKSQ